MAELGVVEALKQTNKGRLSYEYDQNIFDTLILNNNCSSDFISVGNSKSEYYNKDFSFKFENNKPFINGDVIINNDFSHKIENKNTSNSKTESSILLVNKSNEVSQDSSSSISYLESPLKLLGLTDSILSSCDEEIDVKVKNFLLKKQRYIENKENDYKVNSLVQENMLFERIKKRFAFIEEEEDSFNKAYNEELIHLKESHNRHALLLDKKDSEAQREINEKDAIRKQKEHEIFKLKISKELDEIQKSSEQLNTLMSQCKFQENLPEATKFCGFIMEQIIDKIYSIKSASVLKLEDANKAMQLSSEAKKLVSSVKVQIIEADRKGNENLKKTEQLEKESIDHVDSNNKKPPDAKPKTDIPLSSVDLITQCKDKYFHLLKLFDEVETGFKDFVDSAQHKKYRFDLMKAIGETVNTINDNDAYHLREKVNKLNRLLTGELIEISGRQRVSINNHPSARMFCLSRLAKKLVNQGGELVSSKPDTAFIYASVILGLWNLHPSFGDLFLVHLALKCPYLVPYNIEKEGRSDSEYYQLLGYEIEDNGEIEDENKYLKRISGYVTLYAAVIISQPPNNQTFGFKKTNIKSPHGLREAWIWLSRVLGQHPREGITPMALHSFLVVVGSEMFKHYGKQFLKLLGFLKLTYLPKIKMITTDNTMAYFERLRLFIDGALNKRSVDKPIGFIN